MGLFGFLYKQKNEKINSNTITPSDYCIFLENLPKKYKLKDL